MNTHKLSELGNIPERSDDYSVCSEGLGHHWDKIRCNPYWTEVIETAITYLRTVDIETETVTDSGCRVWK